MDDIYDELDNYEDVNALQELRAENSELKVKLQEHAAAMEKLQKDYDTLEMEFKKLEHNYSSLLKTARSEIERKTQQISQLNIEKDMMVLNALKNGKNIRRNWKSNAQQANTKAKLNLKEDSVKNNVPAKNEKCETTSMQKSDTVPASGTYNRSNYVNRPETAGVPPEPYSKDINVKENAQKTEYYDTPKTLPNSIKDRRKSLPPTSMPIDRFSSDDEQHYNSKDTRNASPLPHPGFPKVYEGRNVDKTTFDKQSHKNSETSSIDSNPHEPISRDNYRSRPRYDINPYRGRDKYDVSLKYRKHYSPERGLKRDYRDYQEDRYDRYEQGRYRMSSGGRPEPPSRQHRNYEPRSNYDRYARDHDKYRYRHDDKYENKSRTPNDYAEPQSKRLRTDSNGPDSHRDDRRPCNDKERDRQSIPSFSPHEYDMLRVSCQSPDYVHNEPSSLTKPKEIMATASIPLDDPRVTSKKYIVKKDNDVETLSTALGRNVDIVRVDKERWGVAEQFSLPPALAYPPAECRYDLVKDVYMDIDNPDTNLSIESGEVRESEEELRHDENKTKHTKESKIIEKLPNVQSTADMKSKVNNIMKFRIPKKGEKRMDVPLIELDENLAPNKNVNIKGREEVEQKPLDLKPPIKKSNDDNLETKNKHKKESSYQKTLSKIAIVADDLELSDDNDDHVDSDRQNILKEEENPKLPLNPKETSKKRSLDKIDNSRSDKGSEMVEATAELESICKHTKSKDSESNKKHKNKRKKSKSKETSKELMDHVDTANVNVEKKSKSKKEKDPKPQEVKHKFSELFGDSSSLMTPEDLGIPVYVPEMSEDAQDAVDMKIDRIINESPLTVNSEVTESQTTGAKAQEMTIPGNTSDKQVVEENENKDIQKKKSKNKEEYRDVRNLPQPVVYENLNPGTDTNEPDVVKTIIISTGVQPEIEYESNNEVLSDKVAQGDVDAKQQTPDCNQIPTGIEFKKQGLLKALATSTPQKDFSISNANGDVNCDSEINKSTGNVSNRDQVSPPDASQLDGQDAPDVRIFVKRRRKLAKRPPMT